LRYLDSGLKNYRPAHDLIDMPVRDHAEERRRSPRFVCGGHAKITCLPSDGIILPGTIRDLSLGGCRVDTALPICCGERAEIVLRVNTASFRVLGEVKAIRDRSGAGIEFVRLSARGKEMLGELLQELARSQAVINKFKSAQRDMDPKVFRRELEEGCARLALHVRAGIVEAGEEHDTAKK